MRERTRAVVPLLLAVALTLPGCSMRQLVIGKIGAAVSGEGTTFSGDEDPELIGDALPFTLKFIESLLAESPRDRNLLLAASRGFTQYAYGWVDVPGATGATSPRATHLYMRARNYGLRALEASIPGFERQLADDPLKAVSLAQRRDVPALYWTAASWALAISSSKDDMELLADLPAVEALIRRAAELEPDYDHGAIDTFLISYEASRSAFSGTAAREARTHFERAVQLSAGQSASPFVSAAEAFSIPAQDRTEFDALIAKALAVDVDGRPEWRLQNILAQRRAKWLVDHADEYFIAELPEGGSE